MSDYKAKMHQIRRETKGEGKWRGGTGFADQCQTASYAPAGAFSDQLAVEFSMCQFYDP